MKLQTVYKAQPSTECDAIGLPVSYRRRHRTNKKAHQLEGLCKTRRYLTTVVQLGPDLFEVKERNSRIEMKHWIPLSKTVNICDNDLVSLLINRSNKMTENLHIIAICRRLEATGDNNDCNKRKRIAYRLKKLTDHFRIFCTQSASTCEYTRNWSKWFKRRFKLIFASDKFTQRRQLSTAWQPKRPLVCGISRCQWKRQPLINRWILRRLCAVRFCRKLSAAFSP